MSDHDELTDEERAAFAELPRERIPPSYLEERVVGALRHEGLIGPRWRRARVGWMAAAAAAGVALFAAGTATGQWMVAARRGAATDPADQAARVQETGSAYVEAVARLSDDGVASPAAGMEAARAALHAAALELARVRPDDATIQLVLAVLEERASSGEGAAKGPRRTTFWF
jgi:hypothetical protein